MIIDLTFVSPPRGTSHHLYTLTVESSRQNGTRFFANNATYVAPTVPVLLQILSGAQDARDLMPTGSVIELPGDSSVEVVIPGGVIGGGVCPLLPNIKMENVTKLNLILS